MALEFDWDPRKAARNLASHDVSFDEAATVFGDPLGRIVDDPRHSVEEERFVLLGLSRRHRLLAVMFVAETQFGSSARGARHALSDQTMKKQHSKTQRTDRVEKDEILPEYDFSRGRRNRYASRYAAGSVVVVLDPDVAAAFPNSRVAKAALRALAAIIRYHRPSRGR